MLKSKFFLVMMIVTCAFLATGLAFNIIEMNDYNLFNTLIERFSK